MWDYTGDNDLANAVSADAPSTVANIPTTQPSFDQAGAPAGSSKDILTSSAQLVTKVAGGISTLFGGLSDVKANQAISDNNRKVQLQQSNTAAVVADYQNRTAIAQAQAMYAKAAGLVSSPMGALLALAGVAGVLFLVVGKK